MGDRPELVRGIKLDPAFPFPGPPVELFGHVTLVEG
jgi:hypothetical protein